MPKPPIATRWPSTKKKKIIVGVNDYVTQEKHLDILQIDETVAARQNERLRKVRADRSNAEVERRLKPTSAKPPKARKT